MAAIVNARDVLLQAAATRLDPVPITIGDVTGLTEALKGVRITASATSFFGTSGTTSPATITLTAGRVGGVVGPVVWSVISGSGTVSPSGDTCVVTGSTVTGQSITLRARVTEGAINYDAQIVLTKLGTLAGQGAVNLATQITGQLNSGNITGLGALALLNKVDLNTQTIGALNGATQVTNLGSLAYANAIAANQIGVGTLAAGVIYAGTVNVDNLVGTTIRGKDVSGANQIFLGGSSETAPFHAFMNGGYAYVGAKGYITLTSTSGSLSVNPLLGVSISGSTCYLNSSLFQVTSQNLSLGTNFTALTLDCATLTGSLGNRIILRGVTYNAEVNGAPGTTVKFL